ncbi:hypothetical protein V8F06_002255 [Rhypophila decipiens]
MYNWEFVRTDVKQRDRLLVYDGGLQMATEVPMTTTARRMEGVTGKKQRSRAELNSFYCHNSVTVPKKERSLPRSEVGSATCPKIDATVADFTLANFPTRLPLCWSHEKYTGTAMLLGYLRTAVIWHVFYGLPSSSISTHPCCIHLECPSPLPLPLSAPSAFVFSLLVTWTLILLCIHSDRALFYISHLPLNS